MEPLIKYRYHSDLHPSSWTNYGSAHQKPQFIHKYNVIKWTKSALTICKCIIIQIFILHFMLWASITVYTSVIVTMLVQQKAVKDPMYL